MTLEVITNTLDEHKNAPRILKKRIMDNNELYLTTKLLFTLGTVTATTLIIFAVILARD